MHNQDMSANTKPVSPVSALLCAFSFFIVECACSDQQQQLEAAQCPYKVLLSFDSHIGCRCQQELEDLYRESMAIGVRCAGVVVQAWPDDTSPRSSEDVFSTGESLRLYGATVSDWHPPSQEV